jgi:hypothetical protein
MEHDFDIRLGMRKLENRSNGKTCGEAIYRRPRTDIVLLLHTRRRRTRRRRRRTRPIIIIIIIRRR